MYTFSFRISEKLGKRFKNYSMKAIIFLFLKDLSQNLNKFFINSNRDLSQKPYILYKPVT